MSDARALEFGGTDEELEKHLLEFARGVWGWAARDPRGGGWFVSAGSTLSTNPNTIRWRIRVRREGRALSIDASARALPWTRAKVARIVAFRRSQLEDFLTARARGGARESFDPLRLREPFASYGSGPAAITAGVAWAVACGLAAMAAATLAATLASLPLVSSGIGDVLERARAAQAAGGVALPNPAHPISALGAAFVFALPLAFLCGFVHSIALAVGESWMRADRLPLASFLLQAVLLAMAFLPFMPLLAIPLAVAVPLAIHAGYTIAWGRRRERVREGRRPRKAVVLAGVALAAIVAAAIVPRPAEELDFNVRLALFRDRFMLGNSIGKFGAALYYRHTLVSADPLLKQFYSSNDALPSRLVRTAIAEDPKAAAALRALHFTIVPRGSPSDVRVEAGSLVSGSHSVPWTGDPAALDTLAREAFPGSGLRRVYGLAWAAVYHAGPVFVVLASMGIFAPLFSVLFRVLRPKAALAACLACFLVASTILFGLAGGEESAREGLVRLRESPEPGRIAEALAHPSIAVRHEAAFRAYLHPDPALAAPLLQAADDADLRVRLWAVAALGGTRDDRALAKLVARLDDPELFVRYRAAEGLGSLGRVEAVGPLLKMTRDGSWYEGLYALEALRKIDPKRF